MWLLHTAKSLLFAVITIMVIAIIEMYAVNIVLASAITLLVAVRCVL